MKSNAQRVVGIVLSMVVGLAIQSRAQERTAFVCEGRIGNAATQPGQALIGDFEYDIGTNTAAPQQIGQFQWESGYPIYFSIVYSAQVHQAFFTLGPTITSQVPAEVFSDANGIGNLNLRVRSVLANSSVWLGNLQLTTTAGVTNLPVMVTSNNNQQLGAVISQPLPAGFTLTGTAVFEWQSPNIPGRSQLAFQISASEWKVDLDVDTDRNGTVDDATDEAGEDQWTVTRGAFMPVDQWVSGDLTNVPPAVRQEWAPVVIRPVGSLPAGWQVILRQEGNTNLELVCEALGVLQPGPGVGESELAVAALATNALTLYVAATKDLGAFANKSNAMARLTLQIRNAAGQVMGSDSVKLQVAPIILAWNSLPLERLYCTEEFPTTVCPGKQARKPWFYQWVQDYMELGSSGLVEGTNFNQVVDLEHWRYDSTGFIRDRLLPEGTNSPPIAWHKTTWANDGNGGNIEVFPPYTSTNNVFYPFGRVVMGSKRLIGITHDLAFDPVAAQGIQDPIRLQLYWLRVGHIDEVFAFLDADNVLVADPAFAMMYVQSIVDYPYWDQQIRVGTNRNDTLPDHALQTITNAPNFFFSQKSALQSAVTSNDTQFVMSGGIYQPGDYLYLGGIGGENVRVVSNNLLTVFVARAQRWGSVLPKPHVAGTPVYKWSLDMVRNAFVGDDGYPETSFWNLTSYTLVKELQAALGKPLKFHSIPVAFHSYQVETNRQYLAATANMVNGVLDGNNFYMTDPGNTQFTDLVGVTFSRHLPQITPRFVSDINAWNLYHCLAGEIHCGSNAKRTMPTNAWWTCPELNNWLSR